MRLCIWNRKTRIYYRTKEEENLLWYGGLGRLRMTGEREKDLSGGLRDRPV